VHPSTGFFAEMSRKSVDALEEARYLEREGDLEGRNKHVSELVELLEKQGLMFGPDTNGLLGVPKSVRELR